MARRGMATKQRPGVTPGSGGGGGGGTGETPAAPTGLTSTRNATAVTLTWDTPVVSVASWRVWAASTPTSTMTLLSGGITSPTYQDTTAPDDAYRYYGVTALNSLLIESGLSNITGNHLVVETDELVTRTFQVASSEDDGPWTASALNVATADHPFGHDGGSRNTFMRFVNSGAEIPDGAEIISAVLRITGRGTTSNPNLHARIRFVTGANPAAPTTLAEANAMPMTTTFTAWDNPPAWANANPYDLPDAVIPMQEAFDSAGGWAAGEAMIALVRDNGSTSQHYRNGQSFNASSTNAPKLIVSYNATVGQDTVAPATPTGLTAAAIATGIFLAWTANTEGDLHASQAYEVFRRATLVGGAYSSVGTTASTSYTDGTSAAGTSYDYVIKAKDTAGNVSAQSASATATAENTPTGDAITPGALRLTRTFNSAGIYVPYTADDNHSATATVEYKPTGSGTWLDGLPLWNAITVSAIPSPFEFAGSLLNLSPNTSYDVQVTIADADGVSGSSTLTGSIRTRAEDITAYTALYATATRFVDAVNGSDSNAGTSEGAAWQTLEKAFVSAPAGAVVGVLPGYYLRPNTTRVSAITLCAKYPAVDDDQDIINAGNHAVVEGYRGTRPTGSGSTGANAGLTEGPWVLQTSIGGYDVTGQGIYMWTGLPTASPSYVGVAEARADEPIRVTTRVLPSGWTDAQRAQHVMEHNVYRHGAWVGVSQTTMYLRLPLYITAADKMNTTDPNDLYVTFGKASNLILNAGGSPTNGAVCRVSGLELRGGGPSVEIGAAARYAVVDHNLIIGGVKGVGFVSNHNVSPVQYSEDSVVERNRLLDSGLRAAPGTSGATTDTGLIPWDLIKLNKNTSPVGTINREADTSESVPIWGRGGSLYAVIRHNTMDGWFNGVGGYSIGFDRLSASDNDAHDNTFRNISDDCFENEPNGVNQRFWNNDAEYVAVFASVARSEYGPCYYWRNRIWRWGKHECVAGLDGALGVGAMGFKIHGSHDVPPMVYIVNNTFWTDQERTRWQATSNGGAGLIAGPWWTVWNNLVRSGERTTDWDVDLGIKWVEDYNWFATGGTGANDSHTWGGAAFRFKTVEDVEAYRVKSDGGEHTNTDGVDDYAFLDEATIDAFFTDAANGDLTLVGGAIPIGAGVEVPMISGPSPDMGYTGS
jgi:hypothetical protein